eukprot:gene6718-7427_t
MERFASCSFQKDFHSIQELFRSSAGVVYQAVFRYDGKAYVLKERKLAELGRRKDIMNEVKLLQQLHHPNVVRCEGWFRDLDRDCLFIVLEFCAGGDLAQMITSYRQQHKHFRDRQLGEYTEMVHTFYGTPLYLSPEVLERRAYNEKTDLWSLGVVLYELAALQPPFQASSLVALSQVVLRGEYEPLPSRYSRTMTRCVRWLLTKDFRARPHINQVLDFLAEKVGLRETSAVVAPLAPPVVLQAQPAQEEEDEDDSVEEDSLDGDRDCPRCQPQVAKNSLKGLEKQEQKQREQSASPLPSPPPAVIPPPPVEVFRPSRQETKLGQQEEKGSMSVHEEVAVDIGRVHGRLRKEQVTLRHLLRAKTYLAAERQDELVESLAQTRDRIARLEDALLRGVMAADEAQRLGVVAVRVTPPPPAPPSPTKKASRTSAEPLPVYLQDRPERWKAPLKDSNPPAPPPLSLPRREFRQGQRQKEQEKEMWYAKAVQVNGGRARPDPQVEGKPSQRPLQQQRLGDRKDEKDQQEGLQLPSMARNPRPASAFSALPRDGNRDGGSNDGGWIYSDKREIYNHGRLRSDLSDPRPASRSRPVGRDFNIITNL